MTNNSFTGDGDEPIRTKLLYNIADLQSCCEYQYRGHYCKRSFQFRALIIIYLEGQIQAQIQLSNKRTQ